MFLKKLKAFLSQNSFLTTTAKCSFKAEDITTEKQVSLRATCRSDITTGGGTNSHRSDIATDQIT